MKNKLNIIPLFSHIAHPCQFDLTEQQTKTLVEIADSVEYRKSGTYQSELLVHRNDADLIRAANLNGVQSKNLHILELPELINKSVEILPKIIEQNLDFVKYYIDGEEIEPNTLQTMLLSDGQHDLRIYARDIVENEVDRTFSFTVDNTSPQILIKSPQNNTTVSHSLQIDFEVKDANLDDADVSNMSILGPGKITIFPLDGDLLKDVNSYLFDTTNIADGVYELSIVATDMAENEQTKSIMFTVDHAFIQAPSVISEEKITYQSMILIVVGIIAVVVGVIIFIVKKTRKNLDNNEIMKEDL